MRSWRPRRTKIFPLIRLKGSARNTYVASLMLTVVVRSVLQYSNYIIALVVALLQIFEGSELQVNISAVMRTKFASLISIEEKRGENGPRDYKKILEKVKMDNDRRIAEGGALMEADEDERRKSGLLVRGQSGGVMNGVDHNALEAGGAKDPKDIEQPLQVSLVKKPQAESSPVPAMAGLKKAPSMRQEMASNMTWLLR